MEKESFENAEVAKLMNELFVNIKVDREERPDVDKIYMTYVQAVSGGGGWPMRCAAVPSMLPLFAHCPPSVFLTPSLHPLTGGTYFPPNDRYGRPGFKTVLRKVSQLWKERREELVAQGARVMEAIVRCSDYCPSHCALVTYCSFRRSVRYRYLHRLMVV